MNTEKILMWTATIFIVISIAIMADIIVTQQAQITHYRKNVGKLIEVNLFYNFSLSKNFFHRAEHVKIFQR